ncbi:MAG TPA: AAA family ATPase [Ktedonobacteraceae bacterium]
MERLENLQALERQLRSSATSVHPIQEGEVNRQMPVPRCEIVARALQELWHELELDGLPLIFESPFHGHVFTEHHAMFLDLMVDEGKRQKRVRPGQLVAWRRLTAPEYAHGVADVASSMFLLKADLSRRAEPGDRGTIPCAPYGWICYRFSGGWTALSVHYFDPDSDERGPVVMTALPAGKQDEWLAFLAQIDELRNKVAHKQRRGRIEIIGGSEEHLVDVIKKTSFVDLLLPDTTLQQVLAQRRIFNASILRRYASMRVPRLRKVLLVGPPGTGKTTLLKAEGARHAKRGGLVLYVCAPLKNRGETSWQRLAYALQGAAESRLPTLVLVEDFEMFITDPQELQLVLNTLDGVATPDNPAGTLLMATSNDPEKIDPRIRDRPGRIDVVIEIGLVEELDLAVRFLKHFLGSAYREEEHARLAPQLIKQPGSHFREVCLAGAMRALEKDRVDVLYEDLLWAHETILNGRDLARQGERFMPAPTRKRAGFFSKERP